jgi:hypothetical protein
MKDDKKKMEDNQSGMDQKRNIDNDNYEYTDEKARSNEQGRASFHPGSTTQGGSNFGQGSHALGGESYHQGDAKNAGASYENEVGRLSKQDDAGKRAGENNEDDDAPEKDII